MRHAIKANIMTGEHTLLSTVFGPYEMLLQAGVFWNALAGEPADQKFDVRISGSGNGQVSGLAGATAAVHCEINLNDRFDLVLVPSEGMVIHPESESFKRRVDYLKTMHDRGSVIASVCTGAFLVAAAGLLDDKPATTHWALETQFSSWYPKVKLNTELIIADNQSVVTSGGVNADQDLSMHLIKKFCGQETLLQTARCNLVNPIQRSQAPYKAFFVKKNHGDEAILQCQNLIESQISSDLGVSFLAQQLSIGTRTLNRRFKEATGYSVNNYIQMLRVERAKQELERKNISFEVIANELGYENVSFFRRLFKKVVGISPKEYRKMFVGL